jgi:hypothetical protein
MSTARPGCRLAACVDGWACADGRLVCADPGIGRWQGADGRRPSAPCLRVVVVPIQTPQTDFLPKKKTPQTDFSIFRVKEWQLTNFVSQFMKIDKQGTDLKQYYQALTPPTRGHFPWA